MERFKDRVVLVTGGASGIGRATAELFAAEGARVACTDINLEGLAETVERIERAGGRALAVESDVADAGSARAAVATCVETLGKPSVLCNVAGVGGFVRTEDLSVEIWARTLGVNLNGTFYMSHACLPHLLERPGSSIVNVASLAGLIGQAYCAAYCASKWGVVGLTKALAVEYVKQGLRVNCVCPGGVQTAILGSFIPPKDADPGLLGRLALTRGFTQPDEVAEAIAYLASDAARSVTGVALPIDRGVAAA
jgi:NAD(P)-dependent dehydrogenase (short-subunit alcohol dehydrogenase family)